MAAGTRHDTPHRTACSTATHKWHNEYTRVKSHARSTHIRHSPHTVSLLSQPQPALRRARVSRITQSTAVGNGALARTPAHGLRLVYGRALSREAITDDCVHHAVHAEHAQASLVEIASSSVFDAVRPPIALAAAILG